MNDNNLTWLLIADSSAAKLYALQKAKFYNIQKMNALTLLGEFSHEESRKKNSELVSDKMGEFGSSMFVEQTTPKKHEAQVFATELFNHLEEACRNHRYKDLIIIAPPAFMGLLQIRKLEKTCKVPITTIEKDYTHLSDNDLVQRLLAHL